MLKNLRMLRDDKKVSQQTLADAIGVTQPSINKYENHNIEPDIETLRRMADYFETSVDFIIGHTDIRRKIEPTQPFDLNEAEAEVVQQYRALSQPERECIKLMLKTLLEKNR